MADDIPEIAFSRRRASDIASQILEENHQKLMDGRFDEVPMDYDAIGCARRYVENPNPEIYKAVYVGAERYVFEAFRKLSWEWFEPLEQHYNKESEQYEYGYNVLDSLEQGLSPIAHKDEQKMRIMNYVEEVTYMAHRQANINPDGMYITISTPGTYDGAEKDGYVPELNKIMIRAVSFDKDNDVKIIEQFAIPGLHLGDDVLNTFLRENGYEGEDLSGTDFVGAQLFTNKFGDVIDIVKRLDELSSAETFLGERHPGGQKDYNRVKEIAKFRQADLRRVVQEVADYTVELAKNGKDAALARVLYNKKVTDLLLDICEAVPEQAKITFDYETYLKLDTANLLEDQNRHREAYELRNQARAEAPPASGCGGGGCTLETLATYDPAFAKVLGVGLKKENQLERWKEGRCPSCKDFGGKGDVIVEVKTGRKACASCGLSDAKPQPNKSEDKKAKEFSLLKDKSKEEENK